MDGLVSTGKQIPYTILKIIFANKKKNLNYFINILIWPVDKGTVFSQQFLEKKDRIFFKPITI